MKKVCALLVLLALMVSSAWAQWFREPKLTMEEHEAIVARMLAGDTAGLHRLRSERYAPPLPKEVDTLDFQVEGTRPRMRFYFPKDHEERLPLVVMMHGGGWATGCLEGCEDLVVRLVTEGACGVLSVDYGLAPERQFPFPINDCLEALDFAYRQADLLRVDTMRISLCGEGAGGNLALAASLRTDHSLRGLMLIAPVVRGYADGSVSWRRYAKGFGLDASLMELYFESYVPDESLARDPWVSVDEASDEQLSRLPRTLLLAAEYDVVKDQGEALARRLEGLGTGVLYRLMNGTRHGFLHKDEYRYEQDQAVDLLLEWAR